MKALKDMLERLLVHTNPCIFHCDKGFLSNDARLNRDGIALLREFNRIIHQVIDDTLNLINICVYEEFLLQKLEFDL